MSSSPGPRRAWGAIEVGDVVEVEIEGIGVLKNTVTE
jgi:2-keto-4-pentenoate hydratase/2-oxohepta-3-ene-1,7-dioic acid hydratase in catechol pathway